MKFPIHYRKAGERVSLCGLAVTTKVNTTRSGTKVTCHACHKTLFGKPAMPRRPYKCHCDNQTDLQTRIDGLARELSMRIEIELKSVTCEYVCTSCGGVRYATFKNGY